MTVWWIDPVSGNNANNGTSYTTPKKDMTSITYASGDEFRIKKNAAPTTYSGGLDFTNRSATVARSAGNTDDLTTVVSVGDVLGNINGETWGADRQDYVHVVGAVTASSITLDRRYSGTTVTEASVSVTVSHKVSTRLFNLVTADRDIVVTGGWDFSDGTQGSTISWVYSTYSSQQNYLGGTTTNLGTLSISQFGFIESQSGPLLYLVALKGITLTNCYFINIGSNAQGFYPAINSILCYHGLFLADKCHLGGMTTWGSGPMNAMFKNCILYSEQQATSSIRLYARDNLIVKNCKLVSNRDQNNYQVLSVYNATIAQFIDCDAISAYSAVGNCAITFNTAIGKILIKNCTMKKYDGTDLSSLGFVVRGITAQYVHYVDFAGDTYVQVLGMQASPSSNPVVAKIRRDTVVTDSAGKPSIAFEYVAATNGYMGLPPTDRPQFVVTAGTSYTVTSELRKNSSYGSSNLPKIRVFPSAADLSIYSDSSTMGNTNDAWETESVTFTATEDGVAVVDYLVNLQASGAKAYFGGLIVS